MLLDRHGVGTALAEALRAQGLSVRTLERDAALQLDDASMRLDPNEDAQAQALHDKKRTVATANLAAGGAYESASSGGRGNAPKAKEVATKIAEVNRPKERVNPFDGATPAIVPQSRPRAANQPDWRKSIWGN